MLNTKNSQYIIANGFRQRLVGLLAGPPRALLFQNTRAIHTFGMSYPIDLFFCCDRNIVIYIQRNVPPWRIAWYFQSQHVLEVPTAWQWALSIGDQV